MKRLFLTLLSTAAVCAFVSATPAAAQETVEGAPRGEAPINAEPPYTPGYGSGSGWFFAPVGAAGAVVAAPFDATMGSQANAAQAPVRCHVTRDFYGFDGRYTSVCGP